MKLFLPLRKSLFTEEQHPRAAAGTIKDGKNIGGRFIEALDLDHIESNPFQPRKTFHPGALQELADSIKSQGGIMQPPVVRPHPFKPDRYQIIGGERRSKAARLAGHTHIPVLVREATDEEMATLAMIENVNRADMDALEEAEGYANLQQMNGWDVDEIAKQTGKPASTVQNKLTLNNLNERGKELLKKKLLPETYAIPISRLSDADQDEVFRQMGKKHFTLLEVRELCNVLAAADAGGNLFSGDLLQVQQAAEHKKHGHLLKRTLDKYKAAMDSGVRVWKTLLNDQTYKILPAALEGNLSSERRKIQELIQTLQKVDKAMAHAEMYKKTHGSLVGYVDSQSVAKIDEMEKKKKAAAKKRVAAKKAAGRKVASKKPASRKPAAKKPVARKPLKKSLFLGVRVARGAIN